MKKGRGVPASATETLLTAKMSLSLGSRLPDGWVRVGQRGVHTVMEKAESSETKQLTLSDRGGSRPLRQMAMAESSGTKQLTPDGLSITEGQFSAEDLALHRISSGFRPPALCLIWRKFQ